MKRIFLPGLILVASGSFAGLKEAAPTGNANADLSELPQLSRAPSAMPNSHVRFSS